MPIKEDPALTAQLQKESDERDESNAIADAEKVNKAAKEVKELFVGMKDAAGAIPQFQAWALLMEAFAPLFEAIGVPIELLMDGFQKGLAPAIEKIAENMTGDNVSNLEKSGEALGDVCSSLIDLADNKSIAKIAKFFADLTSDLTTANREATAAGWQPGHTFQFLFEKLGFGGGENREEKQRETMRKYREEYTPWYHAWAR